VPTGRKNPDSALAVRGSGDHGRRHGRRHHDDCAKRLGKNASKELCNFFKPARLKRVNDRTGTDHGFKIGDCGPCRAHDGNRG
jgi:hypothetical protein